VPPLPIAQSSITWFEAARDAIHRRDSDYRDRKN
jgi:hypothetical protein